jgi:hypothetical protein
VTIALFILASTFAVLPVFELYERRNARRQAAKKQL